MIIYYYIMKTVQQYVVYYLFLPLLLPGANYVFYSIKSIFDWISKKC